MEFIQNARLQEGTYTHVEEDSLVHSKMASFYEDLSIANLGDEPVFSVPYVDKRSNNTGKVTKVIIFLWHTYQISLLLS